MLYCVLYYSMHTLYCTVQVHYILKGPLLPPLSLLPSIVYSFFSPPFIYTFSLSLAVTSHDLCGFLCSCHCYLSHHTPQTKLHSLDWPKLSSAVWVVFSWSPPVIVFSPQILTVYYSIYSYSCCE